MTPALGRAFLETEGKAGHEQVVILSHVLWREKFGMRRDVLGETVTMNGKPYTIIGVMPENFDFPSPQYKVWVPAALDAPIFQENLDAHFLRVIGRLKPGVTPERLKAEIDILGKRVNPTGDDTVRRFYSMSLEERMFGDLRQPLLVLFSAVSFLLLIACANVANLMLARASSRQSEMAIRSALGASRPRLIAQLLTEAAVLAGVGGALGIAIAVWGLEALKHFATDNVQELLHAQIDGWALAFVLFVSALSGILFGLGPAFAASRTDLQDALKGTTRSSSSAGAERTRRALVFAEVALACVLLVGCALMMRSFAALIHADPGFRPEDVVAADAVLRQDRYPDADRMIRSIAIRSRRCARCQVWNPSASLPISPSATTVGGTATKSKASPPGPASNTTPRFVLSVPAISPPFRFRSGRAAILTSATMRLRPALPSSTKFSPNVSGLTRVRSGNESDSARTGSRLSPFAAASNTVGSISRPTPRFMFPIRKLPSALSPSSAANSTSSFAPARPPARPHPCVPPFTPSIPRSS